MDKMTTQAELAKRLGISQSYLSKGLRWAEKARNNSRNIPVKESSSAHYIKDKPIRIHALGILQAYQEPLSLTQIEDRLATAGIDYTFSKENNTIFYFFEHNGLPARLTTRSLTVWAKERDVGQSEPELKQAEERLRQELRQARQEIAKTILVELKSEEEVVEEHIAFVEDYFAKKWRKEEGTTLSIPYKDKKERIRVDLSPGVPEFEFTHRKLSKQDSLAYVRHVEQVIDGVWTIDKQLAFNQQDIELHREQAQFFVTHNKLMADISRLVRKLDAKLSQRRLGEF